MDTENYKVDIKKPLRHGSLFSGIGGFDLAAEWMGWENVFHCEWMPFPRKILHHYWPNSISYEDVTKTDFTIHRGGIDILTGGFPCQPYSSAGKRLGKEDERHLWPHMLRAISEIKPTYVVGENVRGLTNWNGGMVFEEVCTDLEAEGYEVQPILLPAAAVGAPHRRDRIWFVACSKDSQNNSQGICEDATNSDSIRLHQRECDNEEYTEEGRFNEGNDTNENFLYWENFPTQSPLCGGNDGLPTELDGITFSKWRNESIKGYGNAIVPQVAYQIFKTLNAIR
jgi:DNA (cytosine-5)-methyltransferase 1